MKFDNTLAYARNMDAKDPLKSFRNEFLFPKHENKRVVYLTGNSLGLQPKTTRKIISEELDDWADLGVDGHFRGRRPWLYYHKFTKKALAKLAGSNPSEVVAMNQLTVNLHLMLATFYKPTSARFKILMEGGAFPSDQYAIESQLKWHGLDPQSALIELNPRAGEHALRTEDIVEVIHTNGEQIALTLFGGVQYYTGQLFDIKAITTATHHVGAIAGFDLAHAMGNVPLNLHNDGVDFAVWCSYKYLNSGPGSIAGAFIHDKHGNNTNLNRLAGWWGHHEKERFEMKKGFIPMPGADGWQVSNVPIFQSAAHLASLAIFNRAGIKSLRKKSVQLTGYLEYLLKGIDSGEEHFSIVTPRDPNARGCQLSIFIHRHGRQIATRLERKGIVIDWREPNVLRASPVPLYNSFQDVYVFAMALGDEIRRSTKKPRS